MIYGSWDINCKTYFFVILGHFLLFYPPPPNSPKNENIKKSKIILDIWSFYTNVPKIMIIAYTVSEIWHVMGLIVIFHYGLFFPFYPPNSPKNENIKKMKIISEDIIILQKCTKSHDHMLYCSWDMVRDGCNYFSFWAIFCPPPPTLPFTCLKNM